MPFPIHPILSYGLPIMITLMVAKWTGDLFNEGIYDKHIAIKGVPFLEWEAPAFSQKLQAKDIMDVNLVYVYPHSKVREKKKDSCQP